MFFEHVNVVIQFTGGQAQFFGYLINGQRRRTEHFDDLIAQRVSDRFDGLQIRQDQTGGGCNSYYILYFLSLKYILSDKLNYREKNILSNFELKGKYQGT